MAARTFIVHVDDSPRSAPSIEAALRLARDAGARLVGVYLTPDREFSPSVGAMFPPEALERLMRAAADAQAAAEAAFRQATAALAPSHVGWRAPAGDPIVAALAHGRACDLVVLGQPDPDDSRSRFAGELVTASLLGAGRPILVVPYTGAQPTLGKRILVATDGGREAARAIGDAMFLLERAAEVALLVGGSEEAVGTTSIAQTGARLAEWLSDHGVAARVERYEWNAGGGDQWLLSRAADLGSDLIVMGGYGHARMREVVLGGMTRTILREMTVPVLMSH